MFKHIEAATEKLKANLDPRPHILDALRACSERLEALGDEATGSTGEAVKALSDRMDSITVAFTGIGDQFTALQGLLAQAMTRMDQIEAAQKQAAAPVPPAVPTPPATGATA